jgi:hypothetical protein
MGRRTRQYNPGKAAAGEGVKTIAQWLSAVQSMKGESDQMPVDAAVAMIHATSAERRSQFGKEIWSLRRARGLLAQTWSDRRECRKLLKRLVAGARFELATFGL